MGLFTNKILRVMREELHRREVEQDAADRKFRAKHPTPADIDSEEDAVILATLWAQRVIAPCVAVERCDQWHEKYPETATTYDFAGGYYHGLSPATSVAGRRLLATVRREAALEAAKIDLAAAQKAVKDANLSVTK